jgi:hypothetical protein
MRRAALTVISGIIVSIVGTGLAIALADGSVRRHAGPHAKVCPQALPLTGDALAPATQAALIAATHTDSAALNHDRRGAIATSAALAVTPDAPAYRSLDARSIERICGRTVMRRSVVINLFFPHLLPSAATSVTTMYVARARTGAYKVWYIPRG